MQITEAEQALDTASMAEVTERELQILRARLDFLRQYSESIAPLTNLGNIESNADLEQGDLFFAQMLVDDRLRFFESLWNEDTFISVLWEFQGLLHFK
jgi:hypothetical protein